MIDSKTLMQGNKILNDGCIVTVKFITDYLTVTTRQGNDITAHFDLVNPIPITSDILSKIEGFKEIGSTVYFYNEEINIGIDKDKEGNLYLYNNDDLEAHPNELNYLHQIQNLLKLLSGKNLIIKL